MTILRQAPLSAKQKAALAKEKNPGLRQALRLRFQQQVRAPAASTRRPPPRPATAARARATPARAAPARVARPLAAGRRSVRTAKPSFSAARLASLDYKLLYGARGLPGDKPLPMPVAAAPLAAKTATADGRTNAITYSLPAGKKAIVTFDPFDLTNPLRIYNSDGAITPDTTLSFTTHTRSIDSQFAIGGSLASATDSLVPTVGATANWYSGRHPCTHYASDYNTDTVAGTQVSVGAYPGNVNYRYVTVGSSDPDTLEIPAQVLAGYLDVTADLPYNGLASARVLSAQTKLNNLFSQTHGNTRNADMHPGVANTLQPVYRSAASTIAQLFDECPVQTMAGSAPSASKHFRMPTTPDLGYHFVGKLLPAGLVNNGNASVNAGLTPVSITERLLRGAVLISNLGSVDLMLTASAAVAFAYMPSSSNIDPSNPISALIDSLPVVPHTVPVCASVSMHPRATDGVNAHSVPDPIHSNSYHDRDLVPAANKVRDAEGNGVDLVDDLFSLKGVKAVADGAKMVKNIWEAGADLFGAGF